MKKYLKLPTHQKLGWLVFIGGFLVTGVIAIPFSEVTLLSTLFGYIQTAFVVAFIIEVVAIVLGKNKTIEEPQK